MKKYKARKKEKTQCVAREPNECYKKKLQLMAVSLNFGI